MRPRAIESSSASWPGLSRPSTSLLQQEKQERQDVDAPPKAGHDELGAAAGIP
jgi:hypothetical protein